MPLWAQCELSYAGEMANTRITEGERAAPARSKKTEAEIKRKIALEGTIKGRGGSVKQAVRSGSVRRRNMKSYLYTTPPDSFGLNAAASLPC